MFQRSTYVWRLAPRENNARLWLRVSSFELATGSCHVRVVQLGQHRLSSRHAPVSTQTAWTSYRMSSSCQRKPHTMHADRVIRVFRTVRNLPGSIRYVGSRRALNGPRSGEKRREEKRRHKSSPNVPSKLVPSSSISPHVHDCGDSHNVGRKG